MALTEIDRHLLERCLSHDPAAWKDFVDRFIGLFVHVINHTAHARSVLLSTDDVEDLSAEIFLTLLANDFSVLRSFRGKSSLATYLTVIARRITVKAIARRRKAEALGHVNAHHPEMRLAQAAEGEPLRMDDREEVERMLDGLSTADAEIIRQYHLAGKSYAEISSQLGIPQNSIGPTLYRARKMLREREAKA